jgi:hypothetical protein
VAMGTIGGAPKTMKKVLYRVNRRIHKKSKSRLSVSQGCCWALVVATLVLVCPIGITSAFQSVALKSTTNRSLRQFASFKIHKSSMSRRASSDHPNMQSDNLPQSTCPEALRLVGKSTSAVVSLTFFAALAYYRNAYMISFFVGSIVCAITGKILKRVLNQERPEELQTSSEIKLKPSDKGMPSSHATSLGFIGTFVTLTIWRYSDQLPSEILFWGIQPLLVAYIVASLAYRIQVKLHTKDQVYVGVTLGTSIGIMWHQLTIGAWPFQVAVTDLIAQHFLPASSTLPVAFLAFPALIGLFVVGSFERRIKGWLSAADKKD